MDETKCTICGKSGQEWDENDYPKPSDIFYCDKCGEVVCYNCLYLIDEDEGTDECSKCNEGKKRKPKAAIIGANGNIFSVLGIATKALKRAGQRDKATELSEKIIHGGTHSYDEALALILKYVDPVEV